MTTPENSASGRLEYFGFDLPRVAATSAGVLYGAGYLIQAITLRNFGVQRLEALKLQYIEVGVTFAVLTLLVTLLPIGCWLAHVKIRSESGLLNAKEGAFIFWLNTCNLFALVSFLSLFATSGEWLAVLVGPAQWWPGERLSHAFALYAAVALFVLVGLPVVERIVMRQSKTPIRWYIFVIEPVRHASILMALAFDLTLGYSFPWLPPLMLRATTYVLCSFLLVGTVVTVMYYMRKVATGRNIVLIGGLGTVGACFVLYICINAYVYSVVRLLPMNRGGKLPVTQAWIISDDETVLALPLPESGTMERGPVWIIDETESYVYVASPGDSDWYTEWSSVIAIQKDAVKAIRHARMSGGGPRGAPRSARPTSQLPAITSGTPSR